MTAIRESFFGFFAWRRAFVHCRQDGGEHLNHWSRLDRGPGLDCPKMISNSIDAQFRREQAVRNLFGDSFPRARQVNQMDFISNYTAQLGMDCQQACWDASLLI